MKKSCIVLVILALFLSITSYPAAAQESMALDRGVTYYSMERVDSSGKLMRVHVVDANLNDPRVEVKLGLPSGGLGKLQTVSGMAKDNYAVAAINGGFFYQTKLPIPTDTFIKDSQIVTKGMDAPSAFGITMDRRFFIDNFNPYTVLTLNNPLRQVTVAAINHPTGIGLVMYTPNYPSTNTGTPASSLEYVIQTVDGQYIVQQINYGNSTIPPDGFVLSWQGTASNIAGDIKVGDVVQVGTYYPTSLTNARDVLACYPMLMKNGIVLDPNNVSMAANLKKRNPRTAVGITNNNHLLLVTVDGRQEGMSSGMLFEELANLMLELGARDALALDGGGSTTMYAAGAVVNNPCDGSERRVANSILIVSQIPVYINSERCYFEVPPIIQRGRTLVPLRGIFEKMGAEVNWDAATNVITATRGNTTVQLSPNWQEAVVNGKSVPLDVSPIVMEGRTLVPLRFISTALGASVQWQAKTESVYINYSN